MQFGLCCISIELKEQGYGFQTMTYKRFSSLPRNEAVEILGSRILNNMQVTHETIQYCAEHGYCYRISSDLFPLITYLAADVILSDLPQYIDILEEIAAIKQTIQNTGVRVSVHPSEFNVLASTNQDAVDRTIRELNFYADFLDMLGLPRDYNCPMNMHINNRDGTNAEVTERFLYNFNMLQENVRNRLVIENDDKLNCWSVKQLIEDFYPKTKIPITFDYLHHACHPDGWTEEFAILACVNTWQGYRPLFHYSESAPGNNPRKHADYAEKDFYQYGDIDYDVDMELKQKDLAIAKFMEGVSV
jgi:UV DNA damage endonuclease